MPPPHPNPSPPRTGARGETIETGRRRPQDGVAPVDREVRRATAVSAVRIYPARRTQPGTGPRELPLATSAAVAYNRGSPRRPSETGLSLLTPDSTSLAAQAGSTTAERLRAGGSP